MDFESGDRIQLIRGDEAAFVRQQKGETGKPIWLCGGGEFEPFLYPNSVFFYRRSVRRRVFAGSSCSGQDSSWFTLTVGLSFLAQPSAGNMQECHRLLRWCVRITDELGVNLLNISEIQSSDNQNELFFGKMVGCVSTALTIGLSDFHGQATPSPTVTPLLLDKGLRYALIRPVVGT